MIEHHSPSSLNLFCASPAMYVLEKILKRRQPVGAPAHRGIAVEAGVAHGLLDITADDGECVAVAERRYRELTALCTDPRVPKYGETVAGMVIRALTELRPYGTPTATQGFIEWKPETLRLPIIGYYDFYWQEFGIIVDLKTTDKLPSQIKPGHARQVSLYTGGNLEGRLTYATPGKVATYRLDDVAAHRRALERIATAVEKFLALSDDPQELVALTVPDLDSFYFSPPEARQAAFDVWGI